MLHVWDDEVKGPKVWRALLIISLSLIFEKKSRVIFLIIYLHCLITFLLLLFGFVKNILLIVVYFAD